MSLEEEVRALIAKSARVEPSEVTPDADLFDDLRIDSQRRRAWETVRRTVA